MLNEVRNGDVIDRSRQFVMVPFDVLDAIQDPRAVAAYCLLKKHANSSGRDAHPSRKRLAECMGYKTLRPVDEAIQRLLELGLLETFPRWEADVPGEGRRVVYTRREAEELNASQTSNGYVVYDTPGAAWVQRQETPAGPVDNSVDNPTKSDPAHAPQDTPLSPTGHTPLCPTGHTPYSPQAIPPIAHRPH